MVKGIRMLAAAAALCLCSCGFFTTTPFPGFIGLTDSSINLGGRIDAIAAGASPIAYDLTLVQSAGMPPRLLILVEPPSTSQSGFQYTGQLVFMDQDLAVLGQATTNTSMDYFSRPYSYAHDGNILAGYTVLTPNGAHTTGTLSTPHGLEGFAFTNGAETYIFACPSGKYAAFDISYLGYNAANWGNFLTGSLSIIPAAARPPEMDPNYANLGYQLMAVVYNASSTEITFVLSEPAQGRILGARILLADATSGTGVLQGAATGWPVAQSLWAFSVPADRPAISADRDGFFLVRRDGWMERYTWTPTGALALIGDPVTVSGDRSLSREYAFLTPENPGDPAYMYRFDPSSRILTRYRRWW